MIIIYIYIYIYIYIIHIIYISYIYIYTNIEHVFLTHGLGHTNCTDPVVHRPPWQAQIVSLDEFAMPSEACRPRMLGVSCTVASVCYPSYPLVNIQKAMENHHL